MRLLIHALVALLVCGAGQTVLADGPSWKGRKLADYLDMLNRQGMKIIYTGDLVGDELRLSA